MLKRKPKTLHYDDKETKGSVGSILARLYGRIRHDLGITTDRYEALMERYINRAMASKNPRDRSAARAGLSKELLKSTMTIKNFVKGLFFLRLLKFDLVVKLYHPTGKVTEHSITVIMDEITPEEDVSEDE